MANKKDDATSGAANLEQAIRMVERARLDLPDKIERRLFPKSKLVQGRAPAARKPPDKEWLPSDQQRLPVDDSLLTLRQRKTTPMVRTYDSHVAARRWIILAVWQARMDLQKTILAGLSVGAALQRSEDAAESLGKEIAEFLDADHDWRVAPGFGYRAKRMDYSKHNDAGRDVHAAMDAIAAARIAAETLRSLANAERNRQVPPNAKGDVWRQGFVGELCIGWRNLTGQNPTADSHLFRKFVDSCYRSLAGNKSTASCAPLGELPEFDGWIGVIRTVVKDFEARPDWDGFERCERDLRPPGPRFTIDNETLAARQASDAAKADAETASLLAEPGVREFLTSLSASTKHNKALK